MESFEPVLLVEKLKKEIDQMTKDLVKVWKLFV